MIFGMHQVVWTNYGPDESSWTVESIWYTEYLWCVLAWVAIVLVGFSLFEKLAKKKQ